MLRHSQRIVLLFLDGLVLILCVRVTFDILGGLRTDKSVVSLLFRILIAYRYDKLLALL